MQEKNGHYDADRCLQQTLTAPDFGDWIQRSLASGEHLIATGNQGMVLRYCDHQHDLAIKCVGGNALLRGLRSWMLRREYRAFQRLQGVPGIPRCYGMAGAQALVLQYVPGSSYRHAQLQDREHWFVRLEQTVRQMHARGVSHGDLKRKANLLAADDGQPYVLDLGTAVFKKPVWHVCNNWLFRQHCRADINAVLKHKYHGRYDQIQGTDLTKLDVTNAERGWRRLRRWLGLQH